MKTLCLIASLFGMTAVAQQLPTSEFEKTVVQIVVRHSDGSSKAIGTAVFVKDDGTLGTVNHVYAQAVAYIAQQRDGRVAARRTIRGSSVALVANLDFVSDDIVHDLAILRIHEFNANQWSGFGGVSVATLARDSELPVSSNLTVVGYFGDDILPESLPATLAGTAPITVTQANTSVDEFLISAFGWPGQSGSPVFLAG